MTPTPLARRPRHSPYPMVTVSEAQAMVLNCCNSLEAETVSLEEGLGRVLAEDVAAKDPLPPFPASVKDGLELR